MVIKNIPTKNIPFMLVFPMPVSNKVNNIMTFKEEGNMVREDNIP